MYISKTASFSKASFASSSAADPAQKYRDEEKRVNDELERISKDSVEIQNELKEVDLKSGLVKPEPPAGAKSKAAALSGSIDLVA